jgi:ABC-type taurine transport system substrate-binding protein
MSRSRVVFFLIIGAAILVVGVVLLAQTLQKSEQEAAATTAFQATNTAVAVPGNNDVSVAPIFAGNKLPTDSLPRYVCAADAFGSYYALQQMQAAGYDVKNGFHLGIIPFGLDGAGGSYDLSEEARNSLLQSGKIDCLFTTLDATARSGAGIITAVIDESAGADQLWATSNVKTLNDLKGKRITFSSLSVSHFFVLYTLTVAGIKPTDVTMIPADSPDIAVQNFTTGQADVVSAWEPNVLEAAKANGQVVLTSDKLRIIIDVMMTSRQAIQTKSKLVQAFHDAWFRTLKAQFEDFSSAASQIASWGNSDWSGINPTTAGKDLGSQLQHLAQAGLTQNSAVMNDPTALIDRLNTAKLVWSAANIDVYTGQMSELVNPTFVRQSATRTDLSTSGTPINNTFLLASRPNLQEISPDQGETLAVLPCRKFDFAPESSELNEQSRRLLDNCVLPVLQSSTGIYLRVVGSAAWPAHTPAYQEADILDTAQKRAQAVVNYLAQHSIDPKRFTIEAVLPPAERRGSPDGLTQSQDRYVEMTLITIGR